VKKGRPSHHDDAVQFIRTIPEFIWELSFGIYLIVKGFVPSPILTAGAPQYAGLTQTEPPTRAIGGAGA
jgi:hypothetical protein